ncbi:hypothetical protein JR316_0009767 [Psilocybe cubensis]|uniref:Uncharacterized protein n=1 Tax=Psilocybe cubensis TaxID=181762 RepID=A0ACB8GRC2_PSICU|nr:hypothetical protein JR316_0009767 [Psilocybe cubensis]KAH9477545.1 hypothetical protein JR316_0009767 [Psilocybe cubensis]
MASSTDTTPFVTAFLVLQLSGAGIFALVVFSALIFRTAAKRHPIWFSFCISWIVFGVSYALLLVAGQQFRRPAPERALCTVQAASVYAAPFLVMGSTLGLVVHLLLNVLTALSRSPKKKEHLNIMRALVVLPWMIWVAVLVGVLVPKGDLRFSHHCELNYNWSRSNQQSFDLFAVAIGAMAMALRILIFTILGCGALGVGLVFAVTSTRGVQFDLALAISLTNVRPVERVAILEEARPSDTGSNVVHADHCEFHIVTVHAIDKEGIYGVEGATYRFFP